MNTPILITAMGYLDDDLISETVYYRGILHRKKRFWSLVACLILCLGVVSFQLHAKNYVVEHGISVQTILNEDSIHVSQEDGDMIGAAQRLHIKFTKQHWDWYGGCFYDLKNKQIIVSLTENSKEYQRLILSNSNRSDIHFRDCNYSYEVLESAHNKINRFSLILKPMGVRNYYISIESNKIVLQLSSPNNNVAIWMTNKVVQTHNMVIYRTGIISHDS